MDTETGGRRTPNDGIINETSPLIVNTNPEDDDVLLGDLPPWTLKEVSVTGLAAATVATSIGVLVITSNPIAMAAGVIGLLVPPYTAFQEQKITDCTAMDKTNKVMANELNNLEHENGRLEIETGELKNSVSNLEDLSEILKEVEEMADSSLDCLEEQLKLSKENMEKIKLIKLDSLLNNMLDILDACDEDGNMILSDDEIDNMLIRVEEINNIKLNKELAKKLIKDGGSNTEAVMKLIRNVMDGDPSTGPQGADRVIIFQ